MKEFGKLKSIVLRQLGRDDFEKNTDGRYILTEKDKEALGSTFAPDFIEKFEQGLDVEVALVEQEKAANATIEQLKADNGAKIVDMEQKVNAATERANKLEAEKKALQETVSVLSASKGDDDPDVIVHNNHQPAGKTAWLGIKPNMKHFHNQMITEAMAGNTAKFMTASRTDFSSTTQPGATGNTINTDELYNEFGTYLSNSTAKLDIIMKLVPVTESMNYMTPKRAITEWRGSAAVIDSVVQQFVAKWTPLGTSTFTPLTIVNRRHKVNLPITPDDINDSWLSWLYKEEMTVDQMPITRFIIEQLLRPRIDTDIETLMIATGVYETLGPVSEGQAGQETGKNMDGYVTILRNEYANPATKMNFFDLSTINETSVDEDNIVDVMEKYVDWVEAVAPLYAKKGMNLFIDPVLYKKYKRKYRELYPTSKNEDKNDDAPDFSKITFVPLEAMRNTGVFFATPEMNFIKLEHANKAGGETKLFMQVDNYTVKIFAEFWLAVGFMLAELVFAYVPETSGSGS